MGRAIILFILTIAIIFAAGCKGGVNGEVYIEGSHPHHHPDRDTDPEDSLPWLLSFNVTDSFGYSTENSVSYIPELDPYIDEGFFEIYWDVDAVRDYIVEYRINDIPDVVGSRLIDAELCGLGLACDRTGYQFCQYNPDFTLSCDVINPAYADINSKRYPLDISDMVFDLPETLYLLIDICDTESNYCEFEATPVLLH